MRVGPRLPLFSASQFGHAAVGRAVERGDGFYPEPADGDRPAAPGVVDVHTSRPFPPAGPAGRVCVRAYHARCRDQPEAARGGPDRWGAGLYGVLAVAIVVGGYARSRDVRMLDGVRSVTPRRACCRACGATHVLSPAWSVLRRRDGAEVIGEALRLAAGGHGHRWTAGRVGRPPGTVRGWLRSFRARAEPCGARRAVGVRAGSRRVWCGHAGRERASRRDRGVMLALRAWVLRFGRDPHADAWEGAVWITGGLLCGRPPLPP